jgi:hypothetical protein
MCLWALLPMSNRREIRMTGVVGSAESLVVLTSGGHRRTRFVLPTNVDGRPQQLRQTKKEQTQGSGSPIEEGSDQLERLATMLMASSTITASKRT